MSPKLHLYSHVATCGPEELTRLQSLGEKALLPCLEHPGKGERDLPGLSEVEISIVDDRAIAGVHREFMDDPSPTDVITFHHGEILISFDTARRCAREHAHGIIDELFLYLVHGLLHLNGHTDLEDRAREEMHAIQDRIWREIRLEA